MKKYYRRKQAGRFPRWKREKGVWWMLSYPTIRLVLPCTNFFKYWLSVAPSRIELPSVNGSHLLWEVINPQKKEDPTVSNWWAQGWDTKDWGRMLHLMLQSSLCDQTRPDFSWAHVLAYFICPILIQFPHSFSPETFSSINHLLLNHYKTNKNIYY